MLITQRLTSLSNSICGSSQTSTHQNQAEGLVPCEQSGHTYSFINIVNATTKMSVCKSRTVFLIFSIFVTLPFTLMQQATADEKNLPIKGETFQLDQETAFVIRPERKMDPQPWVWYAPTLKNLPGPEEKWMFEKFLSAGIAIAGIDVGESYGSPTGTKKYEDLYEHLVDQKDFSPKPVLLARSRGGLMLYNWAAENAEKVSAIAGIYPVCNLNSYPGIERAKSAYGLTTNEMSTQLSDHNPIDRLSRLAKQGVPILHLHGDQDTVVPLEQNSAIVQKRYQQYGGNMKIKLMPGQGHNMWVGWFQDPTLTDFVIQHATLPKADRTQSRPDDVKPLWLHIPGGEGPGKNIHVILIAAEQEYRSEQSLPMLANILARHHGFDCTVLFSINDEGLVDPTLPAPFKDKSRRHHIPGLHLLRDADCLIWMSRFMQLDDSQMDHFYDYFDSGKPVIALRTANHGFWGVKPYEVHGKKTSLREVLGGTFMSHHGGWHRESTRGIIVPEQSSHPILTGVQNIWGPSDVYRCHDEERGIPNNCTTLILGQPLESLDRESNPNTNKKPLPIGWTKTWLGNHDRESKIFHFTMGSAEDFENEGVRRVVVNSVYWGLNMVEQISPNRSVEPTTPYHPRKAGFNYEKLGVSPQPIPDWKAH